MIKPYGDDMKPVEKILRNLSNQILDTVSMIKVNVALQPITNKYFEIDMYVINTETFQEEIILGREFLKTEKLTLIYKPSAQGEQEKINLFAYLPYSIDENDPENNIGRIVEAIETDFGCEAPFRKTTYDNSQNENNIWNRRSRGRSTLERSVDLCVRAAKIRKFGKNTNASDNR